MILTIGATKGGVGKTTLSIQLALEAAERGLRVLLIDADAQGSSMTALAGISGRYSHMAVMHVPSDRVAVIAEGATLGHQLVLIDAGGRDNAALRAALVVTDRLIVPTQPRSFDAWGLEDAAGLVAAANATRSKPRLTGLVVVNMADVQPASRDNAETADLANAIAGMRAMPCAIGRRKSISNAAAAGQRVCEYKPRDEKAILELSAFCDLALEGV